MRKSITIDEFKKRCNKIHNNYYDYSKVTQLHTLKDKVTVICPEHGEFQISAYHHLEGIGCKKCSFEKQQNKKWKEDADKIHNNKYDYSLYKYVNNKIKSTIICPIHGEFQMSMNAHIHGKHGCPLCGKESVKNKLSDNCNEFINKSKIIYGEKAFTYSLVNYINNKSPIKLICNKCGNEFECRPDNHLNGHGCPYCPKIIAKWEQEIVDFFKELHIIVEQNNREILNGKEIDIFLPEYNIGIECNGLYWHNELFKSNKYHLSKLIDCENKGIHLIHIFEDEWYNKQDIIKSILLNLLKKNQKVIYARKCVLKEIDIKLTKDFLSVNHLQGYINSQYRYGLFYNDDLVSVMTFGKLRKNLGNAHKENEYELLRFANRCNLTIIGSASKLLKHFIKTINPYHIISYCDRRIFKGNIYSNLGFIFSHSSQPNYFYVIGRERKNRFNFRKDILVKQGFDKNKTEHQIMLERKIYRIYDCGCNVYDYYKKKETKK